MFIVIMSDIHRGVSKAKRIIENCKRADLFVCLGDGVEVFDSLCEEIGVAHTQVCGNCDLFFASAKAPDSIFLNLDDKKIFGCHGHKYSVKYSLTNLKYAGLEKDADIVLFGHTHEQCIEYVNRDGKDDMIVLNPGSVGDSGCFATIDIRRGKILPNLTRLSD